MRNYTFAFSTANFLSKRYPHILWTDITKQTLLVKAAGYDGIELWQVNFASRQQLITHNLSSEDKQLICSQHQSPREETSITSLRAAQVILALPEKHASINDMAQMEDKEKLTIFYKDAYQHPLFKTFTRRAIQLDPDTAYAWEVKSASGFLQYALDHGFTDVCFDTTHIFEPSSDNKPSPFGDTIKVIEELEKADLLKYVTNGHAAEGRLDRFGGKKTSLWDPELTIKKLSELIFYPAKPQTTIIPVLRLFAEKKQTMQWTVELVFEAIAAIWKDKYGIRLPPVFPDQLVIHIAADIRNTLFHIFGE